MLIPALAVAVGLALLLWSADRFVAGASATAAHRGASPLFVGMVVVGFGTSAPELTVSGLAAIEGAPALALGNAWGSNIVNIGLILGLTALLAPMSVRSRVLSREIPVLMAVTVLAVALAIDGAATRGDALILLGAFAAFIAWSIRSARAEDDPLGTEAPDLSPRAALLWTGAGLAVLVAASRLLVWGAVELAQGFGVSELVIGLTVVAVGTSLPELAASLAAVRRGGHDLALGNVIGSNIFNSLAVVGLATVIAPAAVPPEALWRDLPAMAAFTAALLLVAVPLRRRGEGRIHRFEGAGLLLAWGLYTAWLVGAGSGLPSRLAAAGALP